MSDFPTLLERPVRTVLSSYGALSAAGDINFAIRNAPNAAAAWPAVNRALYVPVQVEQPLTIVRMGVMNGAVAGNVDVGIYSYPGTGTTATRLRSMGATAMAGANVVQSFLLATPLDLNPGVYFLGMVCSTITTATFFRATTNLLALQAAGVQQEALGATTLPATATFANPASSYLPAFAAFAYTPV